MPRTNRRGLLTSLSELAGLAFIAVGVWQISAPAGWIATGLALVALGALNA